MNRRKSIAVIPAVIGLAFARPKLGDREWMQRFRKFVKAFNDFVIALDDDKLDRAKWEQMRTAWREIDCD